MTAVTPAAEQSAWFTLDAARVTTTLGVEQAQSPPTAEVIARAQQYGPNKFVEAKPEPRFDSSPQPDADPGALTELLIRFVNAAKTKRDRNLAWIWTAASCTAATRS